MKEETIINDIYVMIYTLQSLGVKGISAADTVRVSLNNLVQWYTITEDIRYIDVAMLQLQALTQMGMLRERDINLYNDIIRLAGWSEEDIFRNRLYNCTKLKLNKTQIRNVIRKWMPSKENPITIGEVVEDIIEKVKNQRSGYYYYRYLKKSDKKRNVIESEDIYKLVVDVEQSYLFDLKMLKCYTFQ